MSTKRVDFFEQDIEHTADIYDQATNIEQLERSNSIKASQLANMPEKHPDFDGEHCLDCLADLPEVRITMGKIRCTLCQSDREVEEKQYFRRGGGGE